MQKFESIESLRGYMAWWVVLGHAFRMAGAPPWVPRDLGERLVSTDLGNALAVDVFMIVSGFVIAHLLINRDEPYGVYATRRFFRIAPLFYLMLLVAIAIYALRWAAFVDNPWTGGAALQAPKLESENQFWVSHFLLHLGLAHGIPPDTALPYSSMAFFSPGWSLSLEWQFYLVAPLMLGGLALLRKAWFPLLLLVVAALCLSSSLVSWRMPSFLPLALPFFFGGIASRLALEGRVPWVALAATAAASILHLWLEDDWWKLVLVAAIWLVFLAIAARENGLLTIRSRLLDRILWLGAFNPVARWLGRVSYSTYLSHILILSMTIGGGILLTGKTDQGLIWALAIAGIVLTVPVSHLLYRYVEVPGIAFGNRLIRRRLRPARG